MIKVISFEEILPIWKNLLWKDRKDPIEEVSWMVYLDPQKFVPPAGEPTFFAYVIKDKIVGVNSGHLCHGKSYRSRGLWVNEEYRGMGIGGKLLLAAVEQGKKEGADFCWSFPRKSSWRTYEKVGFTLTSEFSENLNNTNAYCRIDNVTTE